MAGAQRDNPVQRAARVVTTTKWSAKAKAIAAALKAEHAAGLAGDEAPAQPVWPTPKEQLAAFKRLFRAAPTQPAALDEAGEVEGDLDSEAQEVAEALRGVDWAEVRSSAASRTNDVTRTMRAMADHVDWSKVQPIAAQVSSALIAAVATGRIPVGGHLGPIVAKAITDQNNLGRRVAQNLQHSQTPVPTEFRGIIEATASE
ncbi:MAG: hypothetical protein ACXWBO_08975 [Ilumatobacteraceae bacterium]